MFSLSFFVWEFFKLDKFQVYNRRDQGFFFQIPQVGVLARILSID
jgi:hypothetical protein